MTASWKHTSSFAIAAELVEKSAIVLALLFVMGCATGSYGHLKQSRDVAQAFETYHVFPDHRYYYLNQENNPYAIVALQNSYTLSGVEWQQFDPQSKKLEKLVGLVKGFPVNYSQTYGSYINDSQGNQIGYWFSSLWMHSIRIDPETKMVSINTEKPWLNDDGHGPWPRIGIGVGSGGAGVGIGF
jgi:hypothetical protein